MNPSTPPSAPPSGQTSATVIDLQGVRHSCSVELALSIQALREDMDAALARNAALEQALKSSVDLHAHTLAKLDMIVGDEARDQDTFRTNLAKSIEGLKIVLYSERKAQHSTLTAQAGTKEGT